MILGVDRLLDMTRTMINVTGDAAVTTIVARSEGELDLIKRRGRIRNARSHRRHVRLMHRLFERSAAACRPA